MQTMFKSKHPSLPAEHMTMQKEAVKHCTYLATVSHIWHQWLIGWLGWLWDIYSRGILVKKGKRVTLRYACSAATRQPQKHYS